MKILIGSLLFATAIFINFPELNSSPHPTGASSSQHNAAIEVYQPVKIVNGKINIYLFDKQIDVYIAKLRSQHIATDCRVLEPVLHIPNRSNKGAFNFITQAVFRFVVDSLIKIVIYVEEFSPTNRRLLGAKLPPTGIERQIEGEPTLLEPNESRWFITYGGIDYVIDVDPHQNLIEDIRLWERQNQRPNEEYIKKNWKEQHYLYFGGIYILVFYADNVIVGAANDPFWNFRPGQLHAHQNPHLEYQRHLQINRPPNHPIVPIPDHHQIHDQHHNHDPIQNAYHQLDESQHFPYHFPDQQHHFEHPNAYLQQNLYQDPYHGLPHTFDTNQIGYHQQNVGPSHHYPQQAAYSPPHYEPSLYYAHENGHSPTHFDPNQNWDSPPYQSPGR